MLSPNSHEEIQMKSVIIIGGGPVGLTLANELSKTLKVTVVLPKRSILLKSSHNSQFNLSPSSGSGALFGNSRFWGNQHEGLGSIVNTKPIFSDLPGFPFDVKELEKYEGELLRQGWPKFTNQKSYPWDSYLGMKHSNFWKGKSFKTLPESLSKKIEFITADFDTLHFKFSNSLILEAITIDEIEFKAEIFVFAAGGLSNIALLEKLSENIPIHNALKLKMLGKGYSNHPKAPFLRIRFRNPKYFGGLLRFKKFKQMANYDLIQPTSDQRPLRISLRFWPLYNESTRRSAIASRLLRIFGFYTEARLVVYLELPQISQNYVRFEGVRNGSLYFKFDYSFSTDIHEYFALQLERCVQNISKDTSALIIEREPLDLEDILYQDANHHFGGTRMASNSDQGVVDSFGRAFGIANLFIVGTSTLPVSSYLHPTLLSAALALRTAEAISKND